MSDQWENLKGATHQEANALDRVISEWLAERTGMGRHIFCAAGCSNCCTLFVQSTLIEALLVAEGLNATQVQTLENYVLRQKEIFSDTSDFLSILRKQRTTLGPCPFLDSGGYCSIYAQRPLACRALLSTKPAEWCNVDFSTLDPLEKHLYLESLDRSVVAFPVHYVQKTQDVAQRAEARLQLEMEAQLGWSITGNFPLLVYLAYSTKLAAQSNMAISNWPEALKANTFYHPLLLKNTTATKN